MSGCVSAAPGSGESVAKADHTASFDGTLCFTAIAQKFPEFADRLVVI